MTANKLQLNDGKTEAMCIASPYTSVPVPNSMVICDSTVMFSPHVKNLGVTLDRHLTMQLQVSNICRSAYIELRRIASIRQYLTVDATKVLVCAFVLSKLDYCNSLLSGRPKNLIEKLQRVQNSAARLIFRIKGRVRTTI